MQLVQWCLHVVKVLLGLASAAACPEDERMPLRRTARVLVAAMGRIPDDAESVAFVETFRLSELFFEAGLDAHQRGAGDVRREVEDLLLGWALKAGRHETGWGSLEHALLAAATLAVATSGDTAALEQRVRATLAAAKVPDALRKRAVGELSRRAVDPTAGAHWSSPIDRAIAEVDRERLRALLEAMARILLQLQDEESSPTP